MVETRARKALRVKKAADASADASAAYIAAADDYAAAYAAAVRQHSAAWMVPRTIASEWPTPEHDAIYSPAVARLNVSIFNVAACFVTRCRLDLRMIARKGNAVVMNHRMVTMQLKRPYCTACIWAGGKVAVKGCRSESDARIAGRRIARLLQKLYARERPTAGVPQFAEFAVVSVMAAVKFPFLIYIANLAETYAAESFFEPEIHPGCTFKIPENPKATLVIYYSGRVTLTSTSETNIHRAIQRSYAILKKFEYKPRAHVNM